VPVARTLDGRRICSTSFSASKIRNTSMPVSAASCTKAFVTSVGYGV
jgi:hypothetical protein